MPAAIQNYILCSVLNRLHIFLLVNWNNHMNTHYLLQKESFFASWWKFFHFKNFLQLSINVKDEIIENDLWIWRVIIRDIMYIEWECLIRRALFSNDFFVKYTSTLNPFSSFVIGIFSNMKPKGFMINYKFGNDVLWNVFWSNFLSFSCQENIFLRNFTSNRIERMGSTIFLKN